MRETSAKGILKKQVDEVPIVQCICSQLDHGTLVTLLGQAGGGPHQEGQHRGEVLASRPVEGDAQVHDGGVGLLQHGEAGEVYIQGWI